ncbi:MAG: type II secretion system protein N [Pseudohongiellaceae bacterium]
MNRDLSVQTALVFSLTLGTLALLCLVLVNGVWLWLAPLPEAAAPAAVQSNAPLLAAYQVFGRVAQNLPAPTAAQPASTGLAIRLLGIIAAQDDGEDYAVVLLAPATILAIREGQEFTPGVRLHEVSRNHLILERGGVLETLDWPVP